MPATIKTMLMMTSALSASPNISVDSAKPPIGVKLNTCVCDDRHQRRIPADRSAGEPDCDRSRHRNRQGYTLRRGSGCRTNGVHFTLPTDPP
jgi:hypothetical protein